MDLMSETTALVLGELSNPNIYCSIKNETKEDKKRIFNVMNAPDYRLSDCINKKISVKDVYIEIVDMVKQDTGEVTKTPRVVLIDKDDKSYQCVSYGVFNSLKKLMMIYGEPSWNEPVDVVVKQVTRGDRKILTLTIE